MSAKGRVQLLAITLLEPSLEVQATTISLCTRGGHERIVTDTSSGRLHHGHHGLYRLHGWHCTHWCHGIHNKRACGHRHSADSWLHRSRARRWNSSAWSDEWRTPSPSLRLTVGKQRRRKKGCRNNKFTERDQLQHQC